MSWVVSASQSVVTGRKRLRLEKDWVEEVNSKSALK